MEGNASALLVSLQLFTSAYNNMLLNEAASRGRFAAEEAGSTVGEDSLLEHLS